MLDGLKRGRASPLVFGTDRHHSPRLRLAAPWNLLWVWLLLGSLGGFGTARSQQELAPLRTAIRPFGSGFVHQMAFDPTNDTLYMANGAGETIVKVAQASTVPLVPSEAAPWTYAIVAGRQSIIGPPGLDEVPPDVATFYTPTGVIGWPRYGVGSLLPADPAAMSWVGLWIAEYVNHALRFIHFYRGNNVTLVAGSSTGMGGYKDGIGVDVLLSSPWNLAWGQFLRRSVVADEVLTSPLSPADLGGGPTVPSLGPPTWTSVVFWSDRANNCLRQGVPLHNHTGSILSDDSLAIGLQNMVLNVSSFAGLCSKGGWNGVGGVVPWSAMLNSPWGIALASVAASIATSTSPPPGTNAVVLFVCDWNNHRVSMITPMYPMAARFLTEVYNDGGYLTGVTIAQVRRRRNDFGGGGSSDSIVDVDLVVGTDERRPFFNISVELHSTVNASSSLHRVLWNRTTVNVLASTNIAYNYNAVMVRYTPNSSYAGTLVVFSGHSGVVLQFYCCIDESFSERIDVSDSSTTELRGVDRRRIGSETLTMTRRRVNSSGTSTGQRMWSATWTLARRRSTSLSASSSKSRPNRRPMNTSTIQLYGSTSISVARRRGTTSTLAGTRSHRFLHPRLDALGASLVLLTERSSGSTVLLTLAVGGTAASTLVSSSSNKAAVVGRTAAVYRCSAVGPAQSVAEDSQQFLSFGLSFGGGLLHPQEGVVRAALIVTSCLRVVLTVIVVLLVKVMT